LQQISNCVAHTHGLRRIYANIANRGEVTKEIIHQAAELGIYIFSDLQVSMYYKGSGKTYPFARIPLSILLYGCSDFTELFLG